MNWPLYVGILLSFIAVTGVAMMCLGYIITKKLKVTKVSARPDFALHEGIRICMISDLHFPYFNVNQDDVIDQMVSVPTDMIAICGDLFQYRKSKDMALEFIRKLSEKTETPIRIVLGNHDEGKKGFAEPQLSSFIKDIEKCGENVKVLRNEIERLKVSGSSNKISIVGLTDYKQLAKITAVNLIDEAVSQSSENDALVILEHNPDIVTALQKSFENLDRTALVLSGHTHGGQFWLPFNMEFLILRDDKLPKKGYKYGLFDYCKNCKLYISSGLGESFLPIRLGTTPEIVFIEF